MPAAIEHRIRSAALVLIGPPGAGKSAVLAALATRLEADGVSFGAIEAEQLAWGSPLLGAQHWIPQLAAVLALQHRAGRRLFLIAATTETADELGGVVAAAGAERTLIVCLRASSEVVAVRLTQREPDRWPGKQRLIARARELARSIPLIDGIDRVLDTEQRDPMDLARKIHETLPIPTD